MYIFLQMQTSLHFVLINGTPQLFKANDDCVKLWTPFVMFAWTQLLSAPTVSSCERVSPLSVYRCLYIFSFVAICSFFRWYFIPIYKKDYAIFSFPLPASLCFSVFLFIGSHCVWFSFFLFLSYSPEFCYSCLWFCFYFFFSPVLFLLVFENINRFRNLRKLLPSANWNSQGKKSQFYGTHFLSVTTFLSFENSRKQPCSDRRQ